MSKEQIKTTAELMATKIRVMYLTINDEAFKENKRFNPFYSELRGIELLLKNLGVEFEYEYNEKIEMTAVIVEGYKVAL